MRLSRPRFTIERLRTLVLLGGILLVGAIAVFLAVGQWRRRFSAKDIPSRLGIDIQQQADGVNYTQSRKGKTLFKIHAARAVQLKSDGKTLLHDVRIELYGEDGKSVDTISGAEFEYDPGPGLAKAAGPVEITLMRPGVAPAITQLKSGSRMGMPKLPPGLASQVIDNEIHVKTSGLLFNQQSGIATTSQQVDFTLRQGSGSSMGATYNSGAGQLLLDHAVELHVNRIGGPVILHASHAEFERTQQLCQMTQAQAQYAGGTVQIATAILHFRDNGSIEKLDGSSGIDLLTQAGSHLMAPRGSLDFDSENHPRNAWLQGGTKLEISQPTHQMLGSAPTAKLDFDRQGQLRHAHLERGVLFSSQQNVTTAKGSQAVLHRSWKSETADIAFALSPHPAAKDAPRDKQSTAGKIEPRTIHGNGGVRITSESTGSGASGGLSTLTADSVVAELASGSVLTSLAGTGHAVFEQRTADGSHQSSSSDQLDATFATKTATRTAAEKKSPDAESEIAAIVQVGHIILIQEGPPRTGRPAQSPIRATAGRAEYQGQGQILHLSGTPRIQNGALEMTANRIDFTRTTGDAFAHGDVKASWSSSVNQQTTLSGAVLPRVTLPGSTLLGGNAIGGGPVHAISSDAELHQASEQVIFRSPATSPARIWQAGNSVSAPIIILDRQKQILTAQAIDATNPVRTILVSNPSPKADAARSPAKEKLSVLRVRSGELEYSEGERLATFRSGSTGSVTVESTGSGGLATVVSNEALVRLLPAGTHQTPGSSSGTTSVDSILAQGHVSANWPGRKGTGEKLVYRGEDGSFTLTGTSATPPRITDQIRGSVTGNALIFHSRDDSVTVEGDGAKTVTETQSPH